MDKFNEISKSEAYRLINHGPVVLVSTISMYGNYNIAPIAWTCPVEKSPTRILICVGNGHQTWRNIKDTTMFIACIPHKSQAPLVRKTGKISGEDSDKFKEYNIESFRGKEVDAMIPQGCIGFIECKISETVEMEDVTLFVGDCLYGAAKPRAFDKRVLTEREDGKTLHHLGDRIFAVPSDILNKE